MCGLCLEQGILKMLCTKSASVAGSFIDAGAAGLYLQEAQNLEEALLLIKRKSRGRSVVTLHAAPEEEIVCRMLAVLMEQGFDAPLYQRLLADRWIRNNLVKSCSLMHGQTLDDARQPFAFLYDPDTFLQREKALSLRQPAHYKAQCQQLVGSYLKGLTHGVEQPDKLERPWFRTLFFSLLLLGRYRASRKMLEHLVTTPYNYTPGLEGYDLWLQRQASARLLDMFGIQPFIDNISKIRPSLIRYLDLSKGLREGEVRQLRVAMAALPGGDVTDDFCSLSQVLKRLPVE